MLELSPNQIMLVGLIASALTFILKALASWFNFSPNRAHLTIALYVIALGLSGIWTGVVLPPLGPFSDPVSFMVSILNFVSDLLAMAAPVVGLATLIYNLLYEKVIVPSLIKLMRLKATA